MKYKDWSDFTVSCSAIDNIMGRPRGATPPPARDYVKFDKLATKDELTDEDYAFIAAFEAREKRSNDPELSMTAIKWLIGRYAWEKYNNKTASTGAGFSAVQKGNELEDKAIEIVSKLDGVKYQKSIEVLNNGYIKGVCDVFHVGNKLIDVKTTWNINTFMPYHQIQLDKNYWFQMQGYMELYNVDTVEVCFVLTNTPPQLIEREREKLGHKYLMSEISKEKYQSDLEAISFAFQYDKIPIKRRVIRHVVHRFRDIVPLIYSKVDKCRVWLNEFERIHLSNKIINTLPDYYVKSNAKEDNSESDTTDTR